MKVEYYETASGEQPVSDYIDGLPTKAKQKVLRTIQMLAHLGNLLPMPFSKPLRDGLLELRTQFGSNNFRVIYFFMVGDKAILTNGFTKKTNQTPDDEIEKAKRFRADHLKRHPN